MREPLLASSDLCALPVYDLEEVPVGQTYGVLTEAETGLVRFFDVSLEGRQRHVLIPTGHARVEKSLGRLRLRLRAATAAELDAIPSYEPHTAWHEDEFQHELLQAFGRLFQGQRYYAHPAYDHTGLYAGAHPLLRDSLAPASPDGLRRLSAARDFRVAEGEPDIRGWDLIGAAGLRIGVVSDLIIDTAAEQVRYVVLKREVDDAETALPIGYVDLGGENVHCALTEDDLLALPLVNAETLERDKEAELRVALDEQLRGERRYERADFHTAEIF
jgi:hypothetical protein